MKLYITATLVDKLLPVASRGDIEGAILALLFNLICLGLISFSIFELGKFIYKKLIKNLSHEA